MVSLPAGSVENMVGNDSRGGDIMIDCISEKDPLLSF